MLSRTDSIGDVVLTLPMAGWLKKQFPASRVVFLGRTYTRDIIGLCEHVDAFMNYDELCALDWRSKKAMLRSIKADVFIHVFPRASLARLAFFSNIRCRIGSRSRWYNWFFCNRLVRLPRKNSQLHEAQLNLRLLKSFGMRNVPDKDTIYQYYGFTNLPALLPQFAGLIDRRRVNVILHPRSKGSAPEWGIPNYRELVNAVSSKKFKFFVSGTKEEGEQIRDFLNRHPEIVDLTGQMNLAQFAAFIKQTDAVVAASTGPLHIAAALGVTAVGLFSSRRPLFPQRWAPLGPRAHALVYDAGCTACKKQKKCDCIEKISAAQVINILDR